MLVDRRKELGKNIIFPPNYSLNNSVGSSIGGENNQHRQSVLDETACGKRPVVVSRWRCLIRENDSYHRIWNVSVSKDAVVHPVFGWICDCGRWTFGDDMFHVPVLSQVVKKDTGVVVVGD